MDMKFHKIDPMLVILLVGAVLLVLVWLIFIAPITTRPEQREHVEVIDKRIIKESTAGDGADYIYVYILVFKFPDGSEKEFDLADVSRIPRADHRNEEIYNSIQIGDTGILAYKERKNNVRVDGRNFTSFEKDPHPND